MVKRVGLTLPGVEAGIRYDGSPVLRVSGCFVAAMATHPSAEPDTLVVRFDVDDREALLQDAPDIYYLTDYYRKYPLVLARTSRLDPLALRDLLHISRRLTLARTTRRRPVRTSAGGDRLRERRRF